MSDAQPSPADAGNTKPAGETPATETGKPSESITEQPGSMGLEQAREVFSKAPAMRVIDQDPLLGGTERDPLETPPTEIDPLGTAETPVEEEPVGETPAEETITEEESTQKVDEEEPATPAGDQPAGRKRLNIFRKREDGSFVHTERDRAILQLADDEGIGISEAEKRLFGKPEAETPAGEKPGTDEPNPISAAQAEVDRIESEMAAASTALDLTTYEAKRRELKTAERTLEGLQRQVAQVHQTETQKRTALEAQSTGEAMKLFPDSGKPGTALHNAITADVRRLEKENPAFFQDPEWPETLAAKHAARLRIAPASAPAAAVAKPVPVPKKPARPAAPSPASGSATVTPTAPTGEAATEKQIADMTANGDLQGLRELTRKLSAAA